MLREFKPRNLLENPNTIDAPSSASGDFSLWYRAAEEVARASEALARSPRATRDREKAVDRLDTALATERLYWRALEALRQAATSEPRQSLRSVKSPGHLHVYLCPVRKTSRCEGCGSLIPASELAVLCGEQGVL
jgi:hypothetical protein